MRVWEKKTVNLGCNAQGTWDFIPTFNKISSLLVYSGALWARCKIQTGISTRETMHVGPRQLTYRQIFVHYCKAIPGSGQNRALTFFVEIFSSRWNFQILKKSAIICRMSVITYPKISLLALSMANWQQDNWFSEIVVILVLPRFVEPWQVPLSRMNIICTLIGQYYQIVITRVGRIART